MGSEIFIVMRAQKTIHQLDIFGLINPDESDDPQLHPYQRDPRVDYSDFSRVFHCVRCGCDFNGEMWNHGFACPWCPYCLTNNNRREMSVKIIFMPVVIPGRKYPSSYQRMMGYTWNEVPETVNG